jgi:hypothetical protein
MKRNWTSIRAGMSRAFQEGMARPDDPKAQPVSVPEPPAPACDRSGDIGSKHIWLEGAQVGDWCLCGKRKKFPRVSEDL